MCGAATRGRNRTKTKSLPRVGGGSLARAAGGQNRTKTKSLPLVGGDLNDMNDK